MELRSYQHRAIDDLRKSLLAGNRRVVIQSPTGSGKTVIAAAIVNMARDKGKRVIFAVPALSLIDQTVERFRQNGIFEIGVMQGQNEMTDYDQPVQVCSVQTLARRQPPKADLVIIDEAHICFKLFDDWMNRPEWKKVPFIGLTATPWAKGMGAPGRWDDLIIGSTLQELIELGHLSDFRCFAPAHPDLAGVKTIAGDYDPKGLGHAMDKAPLVADIVSTWLERGENRATICFAVNRVHAKHIQTQFIDAGVRAEYMDAYTDLEDRADIVRRFADGDVQVICNVGVLTTGFDADVRCIILARPTKSEILYVQMIGRGLRTADGKADCLLRGTKILTDKGEVNIEDVTLDHKLWDGVEWVSHAGSICRGVQPVMQYSGLIATPDHKVMTDDGWKTIEEAARGRLEIAITGFGKRAIRFAPDHFESYIRFCTSSSCRGHVREMRAISYGFVSQHSEAAKDSSLPTLQWQKARQYSEMALSKMSSAAGQVSKCALFILRKIWSTGHSIQIQFSKRSSELGLEKFGRSGSFDATGQDKQQWQLRAGQSPLGKCCDEHEQHSQKQRCEKEVHFISGELSSSEVCGFYPESVYPHRHDRSANCGAVDAAFMQAEGEVWDILNAGPLQRFTANGRLVHNCLVLDHSDTTMRLGFVTDIGTSKLHDGVANKQTVEKKIPLPKECPKCAFLKPPKTRKCPACGFEGMPVSDIDNQDGELQELTRGKKLKPNVYTMVDKQRWYAQLVLHAELRGYKKGWSYWAYKDKFGVGPDSSLLHVASREISPEVQSWITARNIRKAKAKAKEQAA